MTTPPPDAVWSLESRHLGKRVHIYERLGSTNTLALELSDDPARHGLVLLAREQSAGRGQYGRTWQAPPGSSVLMTALLFPPPVLRRPVLLTAWAAVAVSEAIRNLARLDATIKWPNDVLIDGKKVCGILIEQRTTGHVEFPLAAAVGIGLNLTQSAAMFAAADLPLAGSLVSMSGLVFSDDNAARELIRQLDAHYGMLLEGERPAVEASWKARFGLIGQMVVAECVNETRRGRLLDVTFAGVTLESAPGEVLRLAPETIRHLDPAQ